MPSFQSDFTELENSALFSGLLFSVLQYMQDRIISRRFFSPDSSPETANRLRLISATFLFSTSRFFCLAAFRIFTASSRPFASDI
jgi:hypothetical protein